MAKLKEQHEIFCIEYIKDFNGSRSAVDAGFSAKTSNRIAYQLLSRLDIQSRIAELIQKRKESVSIDADYVLKRLIEIDSLDIIEIVTDAMDGFRPISEWPEKWRKSVSGIDIHTLISGGSDEPIEKLVRKIKWPDKVKNLELIGKHIDVRAWDKDPAPEPQKDQTITINLVDAVKPDAS